MKLTKFDPGKLVATCLVGLLAAVIVLMPAYAAAQSDKIPGISLSSFSVDNNGASNLSIPIITPPSFGPSPKLSIGYSSQGSSGLLGMGMSLSGLSAIHRCPRTIAQDNFKGGINFDAGDRYCIDGSRLMAVKPGNYGDDGMEYRTELDTFVKVFSNGQVPAPGSGAQSFTVKDKGGETLEFGNTPDSRIEAQGKTTVRMWALNKITDASGNTLTVTYEEDSANGDFRPKQIDYPGNTDQNPCSMRCVKFVYETRPDQTPMYVGGSLIKTTNRLSKIKTYAVPPQGGSAVLVREYRLVYETSSATRRSRLTNITECGWDPQTSTYTCLPQTSFTYQNEVLGAFSTDIVVRPSGWDTSQEWVLDVNGDGKSDLVSSYGGFFHFAISKGDGTYDFNLSAVQHPAHWDPTKVKVADLNGDGIGDLVSSGGGYFQFAVFGFSNGNVYLKNPSQVAILVPGGWDPTKVWAGDLNSDGTTDLVSSAGGYFRFGVFGYSTSTNSVTRLNPNQSLVGTPSGWDPARVWPGDYNGDGLLDLASSAGGSLRYVFFSYSNGQVSIQKNTEVPTPTGWDPTKVWAGDFNGDGNQDLVSANGGQFVFAFSKGDGTYQDPPPPRVPLPQGWLTGNVWVGDFNGDQKSDLLSHNNPNFIYAFSNGNGTIQAVTLTDADYFANSPVLVGDFDGNGIADVLSNYDGKFITVVFNENNDLPDLLTSIATNLGGTIDIVYKPITDGTVYAKDTDAQYPIVDVQAPVYVVDNYTASNGTGQEFKYTYHYGGAKAHALGRGWLGFRFVRIRDESAKVEATGQRKIQVTNQFIQVKQINPTTQVPDFPFIGLPFVSETADSSGTLFARVNNTYESKDTQPGLTLWSGEPKVRFAALKRVDKTEFDGQQSGFQTADEFEYDILGPSGATLGNLTRTLHRGSVTSTTDTTLSGDEYEERIDFVLDATTGIQRPCHTTVNRLDPPNGTPVLLREKWLYYDGQPNCVLNSGPGLLTKEESRLTGDRGDSGNPVVTHHNDSFGRRDSTTDPLGCTTKTEAFDSTNTFPTVVTKCYGASDPALIQTSTFTWDARFGVKLSATDPNNVITSFTFDTFGRPKTVVGPLDTPTLPSVMIDYLDWGDAAVQRIQTQTRKDHGAPDMISKVAYFDGLGRFDSVESTGPNDPGTGLPRTIIHDSAYDSRGLAVINIPVRFNTEAALPAREQLYDALGRLTRVDHPDNRFATTLYEPGKITLTDERSKQKIKFLDAYGRVKQIDEKNNNGAETYSTFYEYDALGMLVHVQNHLGHHTRIKYDLLGRKEAMCDPNMGSGPSTSSCLTTTAGAWLYEYDNAGNLVKQTDARGQIITFDYDLRGRVKHKITTEGTITYKYDSPCTNGIGRLCEVDDLNNMVTNFSYTVEGRVAQTQRTIDGPTYTMSQEYNALGGVTHETFPDFNEATHSYDEATYTYDEAGWLERIFDATSDYVTKIKYNARGQKDEIDYANNVVTTFDYYDQDPPPTNQFINFALKTRFTTGLSGDLQNLTYEYDETGNVKKITDNLPGGTAGRDFGYDDLDRLTLASGKFGVLDPNTQLPTQIDSQSYAYDAIGNVLSKGTVTYQYCNHPLNPAPPSLCTGTIHPSAVVKTIDGATEKIYHYDNNGNTLDGAGRTFAWTSDNRVISVTNGTGTTSMDYDYSGARIKKYGPLGLTIYPFAGYEVGPDGKKTKFFKTGNETLASKQTTTTGASTKLFYHNDHLGGVNVITDDVVAHNGAKQQLVEYDPWGKVSRREGDVDPEHRFTGQILDPETDLYYYGARYYDPDLARFISPDPIVPEVGNPQALNRYSYVINSPQNYIDPSGYSFWSVLKKIIWWPHNMIQKGAVFFAVPDALFRRFGPQWGRDVLKITDRIALTVVVTYFTAGLGTYLGLTSFWAGALGAYAGGFVSSAAQGQNGFTGGAIGLGTYFLAEAVQEVAQNVYYTRGTELTDHPLVEGAKQDYVSESSRAGANVKGVRIFTSSDFVGSGTEALTVSRDVILLHPKFESVIQQYDKLGLTEKLNDLYDTLGHEFTHIIQARTIPFFSLRYTFYYLTRPYLSIPYEAEAWKLGPAFANRVWPIR